MARKPLKVLICSPHPSVQGGVSAFIEMLKQHVAQCQVTSFWVGSLENGKERLWGQVTRLLFAPIHIAWLVQRQAIDVVHINPSLNWKCLLREGLILLALRAIGFKRCLVYFHGWDVPVEQRILATPALRQIFLWLLRDAQLAVLAPEFKQALEDMHIPAEHITLARTMFDGAVLRAAQHMQQPQGQRSILFLSRFIREKGVYELIDAFAQLAADFPDVDLVMAGDGPEMQALRANAAAHGLEKRILFPGYVTGMEKARLLCDCSLFILPTYLGEGMPVALLEAMGAGKPVISTRIAAIPMIVKDPENGILLESVSSAAIEKALRHLLNHALLCAEIGKYNANYAWQRFEAKQVTADMETCYHTIAQSYE